MLIRTTELADPVLFQNMRGNFQERDSHSVPWDSGASEIDYIPHIIVGSASEFNGPPFAPNRHFQLSCGHYRPRVHAGSKFGWHRFRL